MTPPRTQRNDPCPCGSGRKFKHCHGRSASSLTRPVQVPVWVLGTVLVLVGVAVFYVYQLASRPGGLAQQVRQVPGAGTVPSLPGADAAPAGALEPAPYQYDPRTNRYWDPNHHHWHDGPPPDSARRDTAGAPRAVVSQIPPVTTTTANQIPVPEPAPYFYNPATNKYWDPTHRHWHNGIPNVDSLKRAADSLRRVQEALRDTAARDAAAATSDTAAPAVPSPAATGTAPDTTRR